MHVFGNTSVNSLAQSILWSQWTEREGWWKSKSCSQVKSVCSSLIYPSLGYVTLTSTNLSNTKINATPAHRNTTFISAVESGDSSLHSVSGMLEALVELPVCRQSMHAHSHTSPQPGVTPGHMVCMSCYESYRGTAETWDNTLPLSWGSGTR